MMALWKPKNENLIKTINIDALEYSAIGTIDRGFQRWNGSIQNCGQKSRPWDWEWENNQQN